MGTGYTRNDSSNNIADGNVINASDFDGEFNAIESAMGTSGHTHDGTAAEGGPVLVVGPAQDLVVSTSEVKPKTDNALDLGTSSLQFKDAFFQGTIDTDGIMTAATFEPDGDTAAGDNAAIGYTSALGIIVTGQGSTNDITLVNDADATVLAVPTGTTNVDIVGVATAATFEPDGDTAAADNAAIGYTSAEGLILTGQGSTNDITIKNDADADVITIATGTTVVGIPGSLDVEGAIDVNGTTNLDVVDIDGAVDMATTLAVAGNVDFNGDLDVDGTTNLDVVDIDGAVNMATTALVTGVLTTTAATVFNGGFAANDGSTISTADNTDTLSLISTDADADVAPNLVLYRNSGSPADADQLGKIKFIGRNDNSQDVVYTEFVNQIKDASDGTEDGRFGINVMTAGTGIARLDILPAETVFNEGSYDVDFRVESNDNANMLHVDGGNNGVGIGTTGTSTASLTFGQPLAGDQAIKIATGRNDAITDGLVFIDITDSNAPFAGIKIDHVGTGPAIEILGDIVTNTAGTSNFVAGKNAGNSIASGGNYNVVVGDEAGTAITTGDENTFIGYTTGDATTTASGNTALGFSALTTNILGSNSVAIGRAALQVQNPASAVNMYNVAVGHGAGEAVTTGTINTFVGGKSGALTSTASSNVAIGYDSLALNTKGEKNVAVGESALYTFNVTSLADTFNTAVGHHAGVSVTSGIRNTLIGGEAGDALQDADDNVAIGALALSGDTLGSQSVAIGRGALKVQNFTSATASLNTAVGYSAGESVTTGTGNTLIGGQSGDALTTGFSNVALGRNSLSTEDTGRKNVAIGFAALEQQNVDADTLNTAVGFYAGAGVTTGTQNTFIGALAGIANTTGGSNVAVGYASFDANTTGANNTAIGKNSLSGNTTGANNAAGGFGALEANTTGSQNTAFGRIALLANTTASANTAVGNAALYATTTGANNTSVGSQALTSNTTAASNTAVGAAALEANTTGELNTAIGFQAMKDNTTGDRNVALGYGALQDMNVTDGSHTFNTGVGFAAGENTSTGTQNTFLGANAGNANTTAANNTNLGYQAGGGTVNGNSNTFVGRTTGINNESGSGNVIVGSGADCAATGGSYANGFGHGISAVAGYTTIGESGSDIRAAHGNVTWATVSDERYKKDITNATAGLSFINALKPRTFKYKNLGELPETFRLYEAGSTDVFKNSDTNHGFIAQEVKTAIDADSSIKDGFRLWDDRPDGSQEVAEAALIPVLTKAIQELSTALDAALARITTLEG